MAFLSLFASIRCWSTSLKSFLIFPSFFLTGARIRLQISCSINSHTLCQVMTERFSMRIEGALSRSWPDIDNKQSTALNNIETKSCNTTVSHLCGKNRQYERQHERWRVKLFAFLADVIRHATLFDTFYARWDNGRNSVRLYINLQLFIIT